jgi:hypothetical protein
MLRNVGQELAAYGKDEAITTAGSVLIDSYVGSKPADSSLLFSNRP